MGTWHRVYARTAHRAESSRLVVVLPAPPAREFTDRFGLEYTVWWNGQKGDPTLCSYPIEGASS